MNQPMSNKSPAIKNLVEALNPGTKAAIAEKKCPMCKKLITEFRDDLSKREYQISGMCQACQDNVFREE